MASDWNSLYKALADPTRRQIIELLYTRGAASYTEIMAALNVDNTGKLNYHLRMLGRLIQKDEQGRYTLSESGVHAASLLKSLSQSRSGDPTTPSGSGAGGGTSLLRLAGGIVLIIVGVLIIVIVLSAAVALPFFALTSPSVRGGANIPGFTLEPHITRFLIGIPTNSLPEKVNITWSSSAPVSVFVLNRTQANSLFFSKASTEANTTPTSWVEKTSGAKGDLILNYSGAPPLYLAVSSNTSAYVQRFTVSYTSISKPEQSYHSAIIIPLIVIAILVVFGLLIVYLGVRLVRGSRRAA